MKKFDQLSIADALEQSTNLFRANSGTARQDASVLLANLIQRPRAWIMAHPEVTLTVNQKENFEQALKQVLKGVPLPYIIGHWEFYGLDFTVSRDVLIPRPETELLVGTGIEWLKGHPDRRLVADIGTGSGCIAVSLAVKIPDLKVYATDLSAEALRIAERNIQRHRVGDRIVLLKGYLTDILPEPVDMICANLPYIPSQKLGELPVAKFEPFLALNGGEDGMVVIQQLLSVSSKWIKPGGVILIEIESSLGRKVEDLAKGYYQKSKILCKQDLAGKDRLILIDLEKP